MLCYIFAALSALGSILLVFGTVIAIGFVAVAVPVRMLTRKILSGGLKKE